MGIEDFDGVLRCARCNCDIRGQPGPICRSCKRKGEKRQEEEALKKRLGDEYCPKSDDHQHCHCWYDGEVCCRCGAAAMTKEYKQAQGMEPCK